MSHFNRACAQMSFVLSLWLMGVPGMAQNGITASAVKFVKADSTTSGNWNGMYGKDGYNVINNAVSYPAYASVAPTGQSAFTWAASTTDTRALQQSAGTSRIAACWYSATTFTVDVNLTDGLAHQVSFYCLDWDKWPRTQKVEVLDASTNTVLDTQNVSGFGSGVYLVYTLTGHVKVRCTNTAAANKNAVISGIFFDAPAATTTPPATNRITWNGAGWYLTGANFPWLNYATDFGTGGWGKLTDWSHAATLFATMHSNKVSVVRWWVFGDGRYSPEFVNPATDSAVTGLDGQFMSDVDTALKIAHDNNIYLIPVLVDSLMFGAQKSSGGVYGGGHTSLLVNAALQQSYLDNALKPFLQHVAASPYKNNVLAYDICNEIEYVIGGLGGGGSATTIGQMQTFLHNCANYIHQYGGGAYATAGTAQLKWLQYSKGCGFDFYQAHWYPQYSGEALPLYSALGLDKPCIIGEFTTNLTNATIGSTAQYSAQWYLDTISARGYAGALGWSFRSVDAQGNWPIFQPVFTNWVNTHPGIAGPQ